MGNETWKTADKTLPGIYIRTQINKNPAVGFGGNSQTTTPNATVTDEHIEQVIANYLAKNPPDSMSGGSNVVVVQVWEEFPEDGDPIAKASMGAQEIVELMESGTIVFAQYTGEVLLHFSGYDGVRVMFAHAYIGGDILTNVRCEVYSDKVAFLEHTWYQLTPMT